MKAWEEVAPEPLTFEIRGKTYTIPELGYKAMLTIQAIKAGKPSDLDEAEAVESWRLVMGSTWDEMVADNVPAEPLMRAGLATLAFFQHGPETAEQIWEKGVDPKAILAALAAQIEPPKQSSTDAANATRSRASSNGTSSRPASPRKSRAKASRTAT